MELRYGIEDISPIFTCAVNYERLFVMNLL